MSIDYETQGKVREAILNRYHYSKDRPEGDRVLAAFDAAMAELDRLRAEICVTVDAAGVMLRVRNALKHCAEKHGAVAAQQAFAEVEHFTAKHGMAAADHPRLDQPAKADAGMSAEEIDRRIYEVLRRLRLARVGDGIELGLRHPRADYGEKGHGPFVERLCDIDVVEFVRAGLAALAEGSK